MVVLFHPNETVLHNIESYIDQVSQVVAVDNTPDPNPDILRELRARGVQYMSMGGNKGIAAALNVGCDQLRGAGWEWSLTMDQDSTVPSAFVENLTSCLVNATEDVAIVAPLWEHVGGLRESPFDHCVELDWAMTTGNLLRLDALESVGGFREEFFIDHVDTDLCFRLRMAGWRILQSGRGVLMHRQGALRRTPLGFYVTDYPAIRRYYRIRNALILRREYGRVFPDWVATEQADWRRNIPKILLSESCKIDKLRMVYQGWRDSRASRLGRYEDLHG